jgi:ABC-type lipoprotein release transport system permease subunit
MKLEKFSSGMHYIMINDDLTTPFLSKNIKRVVCKINDSLDFHCAFMPKKEGGFSINIGSSICNKLNLKLGDSVTLSFREDTTEYQFEMPEELTEVFYQDPDAFTIFDSLTDGNKRSLIYLVNAVKSSEKRIERALKIVEKLKMGITKPQLIMK